MKRIRNCTLVEKLFIHAYLKIFYRKPLFRKIDELEDMNTKIHKIDSAIKIIVTIIYVVNSPLH